jgi:hypothetical protein
LPEILLIAGRKIEVDVVVCRLNLLAREGRIRAAFVTTAGNDARDHHPGYKPTAH